MFVKVLAFTNGVLAKVDGVLGTPVITAHTIGAMAVPLGTVILYCDILQRAALGAYSAANAGVRYTELAVGNEQTVKQWLEYIGFQER